MRRRLKRRRRLRQKRRQSWRWRRRRPRQARTQQQRPLLLAAALSPLSRARLRSHPPGPVPRICSLLSLGSMRVRSHLMALARRCQRVQQQQQRRRRARPRPRMLPPLFPPRQAAPARRRGRASLLARLRCGKREVVCHHRSHTHTLLPPLPLLPATHIRHCASAACEACCRGSRCRRHGTRWPRAQHVCARTGPFSSASAGCCGRMPRLRACSAQAMCAARVRRRQRRRRRRRRRRGRSASAWQPLRGRRGLQAQARVLERGQVRARLRLGASEGLRLSGGRIYRPPSLLAVPPRPPPPLARARRRHRRLLRPLTSAGPS